MDLLFLWALVGLQIKHFIADYTLQWPSMIAGKSHLNRSGGYLHAGIHIALTLLVVTIILGLILVRIFDSPAGKTGQTGAQSGAPTGAGG